MFKLSSLLLSCEYQPFVAPRTQQIEGYEALARFYTESGQAVAPNRVFEQLHDDRAALAAVEFQAKTFQLQYAPKAPLFINLDPHAVNSDNLGKLLTLLSAHPQLTVELIENACINDAKQSLALIHQLKEVNLDVALDDIGAPNSMLSIDLLMNVDYFKLDRQWLSLIDKPHGKNLLSALIGFAKGTGKRCILEGIETQAHLEQALMLEVDLVQGFLFKPWFIRPHQSEALVTDMQLHL